MSLRLFIFIFSLILTLSITSSCNNRKKIVYFQNEGSNLRASNYVPTFKIDDFLSIIILADNPETVVPFNLPNDERRINSSNGYEQGNPEKSGYLIDENGNVDLPIIGTVHLAGLKRTEAIEMLKEKLTVYLKNPIVNIQILNYKITVLGDVRSPGTFKIPNERITILEAIGLAGDLKMTGERNNVLVIREKDGEKKQYRFDLTNTNEVFNSPIYYLEQNDVVYVEPNPSSRADGTFWKSTATIFISTAGVIVSTISVLSK